MFTTEQTTLTPIRFAESELAGETVILLPERALYWPYTRTIFIADAHFGKAASFRAKGLLVPGGTTADNLRRLDSAIERSGARNIVFLGDFLHSRAGRIDSTLDALASWRARHCRLNLMLVRGNHDRHAGDPPELLEIETVAEPYSLGPFALCHEPQESDAGYVLSGHLHPGIVLRGKTNDALRLACFWFTERYAVLPAFGAFTGSYFINRAFGDRVFVIADDSVIAIR